MTTNSSSEDETYKPLSTPEAEHLAELYLIQGDLNTAYDTLDLYFEKYAVNEGPRYGRAALVAPSLFRDGILLFCSCFSTKDKSKLHPETVYAHLGADRLEYAQKLLDLRDAFVAHNFGPQRQHNIVVICPKADGKLLPYAFTQYFVRFSGWVGRERTQLLPFIDVAREHLKKVIATAEAEVMDQVVALTSEQLEALPDAEIVLPEPSDYRSSRSRFRQSGRGSRLPVPQRRLGRTVVVAP